VTNTSKRLEVFSVKEQWEKDTGQKHSSWVKAGTAWVNRDGSINVYLDVLPIDGKLHVREPMKAQRANPEATRTTTAEAPTSELNMDDSLGGH
jgi:hypothetical protein